MADSIGSIITQWLRDNNLESRVKESSVPDYWREIVGEAVAAHTEVERVSGGRMVIRAENPTWRVEILGRREEIRKKVNERLGADIISEIFVH